MDQLHTDVLVVGGGGAAARAAIEAFDSGARVLLVTKGKFGAGGATAYAIADFAGLAVADGAEDPTDTPDLHLQDIREAGLGMCDPRLSRILVEESLEVVPDLERWGVELERAASGKYLITQACFSSRPRNYKLKGHGRRILEALATQVRAREVTVLQDAMVVDVLADRRRIVGALLVTRDGKWIIVNAGAVVLATGGAGQLFKFNMNPPDITGDGYAIGYRAGAELFNMEFTQYGLGTIAPSTLFPFWLWPFKPMLRNGAGEDFMPQYLPGRISTHEAMAVHARHFPFTNRLSSRYLEIAIHKELSGGRGGSREGIWADFRKCLDCSDLTDTAQKLWPTTQKWFASRGMDLARQPIEIACFAHAMNGGFRVNEHAETSIKGLFAAGETAGGPHGADRLGGCMLTACQVFGKRAGRAAAAWAMRHLRPREYQKAIVTMARPLARFNPGCGSGRCTPAEIKRELQELSFKHLLLIRTEHGLRAFRQELDGIEDKLKRDCRIESTQDTMKAIEVENLIQTGRIVSQVALERRETRGSHYREDFPETRDAAEWLTVHQGAESAPAIRHVPVNGVED